MAKRKSGSVALILMAVSLSAMTTAQEGKGLWGVKPLPLAAIKQKATFLVLTPKAPPGQYTLQKAEIAWVQKSEWGTPGDKNYTRLPARRIVCLFYKIRDKGIAAVIQAKVINGNERVGSPTDSNVYQAVAEGYFFDKIKLGTVLSADQAQGTVFLIVTRESNEDVQALQDALLAK